MSPSEFRTNVDVDGDDTPDFRGSGSDRGLSSLTSRLPWGVIVIYGAASVITRVAQTTGVAKVAFDTRFWSQQSDLVKQVLLTIASSLMAEFMNATTLCDAILPMVVSLSTDTEHDALYFGLPVAVGASVNTIMPVSLPLVMLHDVAPVTRKQLILTGAFVKTVVVASILVSMNTTGEYVLNSSRQFNNTESLQTLLLG
ncbi:sodium-dependent high-affinity dicarboxylate transporter 2-like [Rhipicephalus sanguineus]|nr:sodium-dependent high-affinity dicarboxylate transporter 2-like [Rhipicephalus sanguineus]